MILFGGLQLKSTTVLATTWRPKSAMRGLGLPRNSLSTTACIIQMPLYRDGSRNPFPLLTNDGIAVSVTRNPTRSPGLRPATASSASRLGAKGCVASLAEATSGSVNSAGARRRSSLGGDGVSASSAASAREPQPSIGLV